MKFNFPINNFSSGEWSPRMMGRTDTDQYARACEDLTNMIPQMTGGATYRGGFQNIEILTTDTRDYINLSTTLGDPFNNFKLLSYTPYNRTLATILAMAPGKWYTLPLGVEVTYSANVIAQIAGWNPSSTTHTVLGDLLILLSLNGSHKPKVFRFNQSLLAYQVQDIDNEYITKEPWKTIPWDKVEALDSNVTLNPSATTGTITVTASAAFFSPGMVGSYLRFCNGTSRDGVVRITATGSATSATATVLQTLPNASFSYGSTTNNASFWQQSAWSNAVGWPRTVTSFQGRLIFGGAPNKPDTLWGSRISSYFDFQEVPSPNTTGPFGFASAAYTADNTRPFTLTPNSQEASNIQALSAAKTLTIHTDQSEIVAYGSDGALGPNNVVFESSTSFGAAPVQPVRVNNFLTFVQATGRKIRDLIFNYTEDQYKSTDLTFVADHYFLNSNIVGGVDKIKEMVKIEGNSSVLYVRTFLGFLYTLTLDRDYQVNAWSKIPIGKSPQHTEASPYRYAHVIAMCGHGYSGENETLYALVIRKVDTTSFITFERLTPPWEMDDPADFTFDPGIKPIYLDCAAHLAKDSPYVWVTNNADADSPHRATTVSVVADGNYIGEYEVADDAVGTLTLEYEYDEVLIGYKYLGRIVTTPIEQGGQTGTPMARQKRINELVIRFFNTAACHFGKPGTELDEIPFRSLTDPLDTSVQYFTGDKVVDFPTGYERRAQVVIEQRRPYPLHVVAVIPNGSTYD